MRRRILALSRLLTILAALSAVPALAGEQPPGFVALCYHEIPVEINGLIAPDAVPVAAGQLIDQFDWLRENGYTVIGIEDILAARDGGQPLPEKAVLLTFDDGYAGFYSIVFPLLKTYKYKALLALETGWLETPDDQPVVYGENNWLPRSYFLSWEEVKELADSGWVELASHSHNLHRAHVSMPQGILQPSAAVPAYDADSGTYETEEEYCDRIRADVGQSADIIFERTGYRPRVMVWPYGRYSNGGVRAALDAGYQLTASLGLWADDVTFPRYLMTADDVLHDVMVAANRGFEPGHSGYPGPSLDQVFTDLIQPVYSVRRVMHVDLDAVHDNDPEQQNRNVTALFDRIEALGVNTIYLQAFADPEGNGIVKSLYFPNRHLPMRADLFNYVSWQLQNRLRVRVYAWMPVLGFELAGRPLVQASRSGAEGSTYKRLTPFDEENRRIIREIFEDLGRHSIISGIIYHDDAVLGDYEDAGPAGTAWLESIGLPPDVATVRGNHDMMCYFTRMKTKFLIDFTNELTQAAQIWSPRLRTARNMYAQVAINPDSEEWFAQNYDDFLRNYHYVGLMAMPYMEGERRDPDGWLKKLARIVVNHPLGRQKTVFELQAMDWQTRTIVPSETLARQMRMLQINGIGNLGYYPEDPIRNHPDINTIYPSFSLVNDKYLRKVYNNPYARPRPQDSPGSADADDGQASPPWYVERELPPRVPDAGGDPAS